MSVRERSINKFCWLFIWNKKARKKFRQKNIIIPNHYGKDYIYPPEEGNKIILNSLQEREREIGTCSPNRALLVARFGATELDIIRFFFNNMKKPNVVFPQKLKDKITALSGFFPATDENLTRFCSESLNIIQNIDIMAVWNFKDNTEEKILKEYGNSPKLIQFAALGDSLWMFEKPWSEFLKGKKVLVIHPFEETIKKQYAKRKLLFKNPSTLPEFELKTIKAVQSLGGKTNGFKDWFEALDSMYRKIDEIDFDIALTGAGAYGMFLANYIKNKGKHAIHVGGALQLLFGIKGSRWIKEYGENYCKKFMNEHWIYPLDIDKITEFEGLLKYEKSSCYW